MKLNIGPLLRFFKVIRYPNLLIMAGTQCMAAYFLSESVSNWPKFIFILLATLFIAAGGYIINDIFDANADGINKPGKAYITEANKKFYAQAYYGTSAFGVLLGMMAGIFAGLICLVMAALLFYYSYRLKKTMLWGNITVALMSAMVTGILPFALPELNTAWLWVYSGFAFITTLVREVIKDIEDVEGDKDAGCQTLPVVKGVERAQKIAIGLAILQVTMVIGFAIGCLYNFHLLAFLYLVILVAIPSVGLTLLVAWAKEKKHYSQASSFCKLIMLAGILSMILM